MYAFNELVQAVALWLAQGARLLVAARNVNVHVGHWCGFRGQSQTGLLETRGGSSSNACEMLCGGGDRGGWSNAHDKQQPALCKIAGCCCCLK